jgi:hypothetical protein
MTNGIRIVRTRCQPTPWLQVTIDCHLRLRPNCSGLAIQVSSLSGIQAFRPKKARQQGDQAPSRVHLLYVSPPPFEIKLGLSFFAVRLCSHPATNSNTTSPKFFRSRLQRSFPCAFICPILFAAVSRRVPQGAFRLDVQTIPNFHIRRVHSLTDTRPPQLQTLVPPPHIPSQHGGGQSKQPVINSRGG